MPKQKTMTRKVTLEGLRPILFDRYAGDNSTTLKPDQKLYLTDGGVVCLPALNFLSFLSAQNSLSAAKFYFPMKEYKRKAMALLSFVSIQPDLIEMYRLDEKSKPKPIVFQGFRENDITPHFAVARLPKGIPNPVTRPMVHLPWMMTFQITLIGNDDITEDMLVSVIERGGYAIGLGSFRGPFGKFAIKSWEEI